MAGENIPLVIVLMAIVTLIPRIGPLVWHRKRKQSERVQRVLKHLPWCLLTSLFVLEIVGKSREKAPYEFVMFCTAAGLTFFVASKTRSLVYSVGVGLVVISILRFSLI